MSENKKGEIFSFEKVFKRKQAKELEKELGEPQSWLLIKYIVEEYLSGENGQKRLIMALENKINKLQDREDVLDFIEDLVSYNGEDEEIEKEAQNLEDEFGLVDILLLAISKNKEQIIEEINSALAGGIKKARSAAAELSGKSAKTYQFRK